MSAARSLEWWGYAHGWLWVEAAAADLPDGYHVVEGMGGQLNVQNRLGRVVAIVGPDGAVAHRIPFTRDAAETPQLWLQRAFRRASWPLTRRTR